MEDTLRYVLEQGPFGLAAAFFAFQWWLRMKENARQKEEEKTLRQENGELRRFIWEHLEADNSFERQMRLAMEEAKRR